MIAIGVWLLNRSEKNREMIIEKQSADLERGIKTDRQRQVLLELYLDRMSDLLLEKELMKKANESGETETQVVARATTISVISGLDGLRKGLVLQFLYEAKLIGGRRKDAKTILKLNGGDFSGVIARKADLGGAKLMNANFERADFTQANLSVNFPGGYVTEHGINFTPDTGTSLAGSSLRTAILRDADLTKAFLRRTDFTEADLSGAKLIGANLMEGILEHADLRGADLSGAVLIGANLRGALVDDSQLEKAATLNKAILPDGSSYDGRFDKSKSLERIKPSNKACSRYVEF